MDISFANFWETTWAQGGVCFLSWNAGAGRLLIPEQAAKIPMPDMMTAKRIIIDRRSCRPGLHTDFDVVFDFVRAETLMPKTSRAFFHQFV